ncbi:MAG: BamA/TamA family outer membrane protein [Parachlamydiales bacterium]|nr:BamA/TamA family outer membrane protein [Parachlamydiales bacterium]
MMRRFLTVLAPAILFALPYEVTFVGLENEKALNSIRDAADLITLQERPPASINGIRYRIAGDIPDMLKVLRAYGYYDATITSDVQVENEKAQVTIYLHTGPQYTLRSYQIFHGDCTQPAEIPCCDPLTPERLGLKIGSPLLSFNIVNAELNLLSELSRCGYPLASVEKRKVIVDMDKKDVEAAACIDEGPLSKFGPVSIFGLKTVKAKFVLDRISWDEGKIYSSDDVQHTQKRLLDSDLFSSVLISHDGHLDENGQLPMKMRLSEAKHRQISLGVFYATVDGPGGIFTWTHRNLRGLGESVSLNGEFSKRYLAGTITYKKPDFWTEDQTLRAMGQIERQDITAYIAFLYRFATFIERKWDVKTNVSFGLEVQHINVADSASDGRYNLIDLPVFIRYNTSDDLLNPTKGYTIVYQPHLFQSLDHGAQHFIKQRLTTTFYLPLIKKWFVFAGRFQFGSIAGAKQKNVPLPILFLGGSEDDLRGYRYLTVSPLDGDKPLGGRSAIFISLEPRFRFGDVGIVPFADFGTVAFNELPTVDTKWFKSLGLGLRYFTFFGPLRLDIGFPLDRRSIDPAFRIYASIGQTY